MQKTEDVQLPSTADAAPLLSSPSGSTDPLKTGTDSGKADAITPKSEKPLKTKKKKKPSKRSKPGVIYLSRVPPGLDVGIVRSILGRVGPLGRIWLRAESAAAVAERRNLGGRRRAGYTDGWVEFARADDAAAAVELLNRQPMTGATRRGKFQNDLWCMRLLPDYSWEDLVDEACGTRRERVLRVKREVAAARRERAFVEQRAALAKSIAKKEEKRRSEAAEGATIGSEEDVTGEDFGNGVGENAEEHRMVRRYRQKRPIEGDAAEERRKRYPGEGGLSEGEGADERRALQRLEREQAGDGSAINSDLISKLFKRQRT